MLLCISKYESTILILESTFLFLQWAQKPKKFFSCLILPPFCPFYQMCHQYFPIIFLIAPWSSPCGWTYLVFPNVFACLLGFSFFLFLYQECPVPSFCYPNLFHVKFHSIVLYHTSGHIILTYTYIL